ncbi:uncharacterized protein LOC136040909 [Artemia franciscana]|uniref:uncharacterized protein LOC136040909 n=1 Tax=Artemia franciscana TaxID=6661 RepID=UPI0032DB72D0
MKKRANNEGIRLKNFSTGEVLQEHANNEGIRLKNFSTGEVLQDTLHSTSNVKLTNMTPRRSVDETQERLNGTDEVFQFFKKFRMKCEELIHSKRIRTTQIQTEEDWEKIPTAFFKAVEESKILGLDCEWKPQNQQVPVALMQLASHSGECL